MTHSIFICPIAVAQHGTYYKSLACPSVIAPTVAILNSN